MRAGAADIRRLAAKGLSGAEAGRLAVAHLLKIEYGKAGILGKADIEGLRACLRNQSEEDDYQRMLGLHGAARLMLAEAQIASLQIVGLLEGLRHRLECCLIWDDAVADLTEQPERTLALASRMAAVLAAYQQVLAEMGRIAHASFSSSLLGVVPFELGALLADDGSVWGLSRGYLVGAQPGVADDVQSGALAPISMRSGPNHSMGPVHAEVQVRGWSAYVVDRGADGGTWLQGPGSQGWDKLARNEQRELPNGSHVSCGGRVLTYLSAWPA